MILKISCCHQRKNKIMVIFPLCCPQRKNNIMIIFPLCCMLFLIDISFFFLVFFRNSRTFTAPEYVMFGTYSMLYNVSLKVPSFNMKNKDIFNGYNDRRKCLQGRNYFLLVSISFTCMYYMEMKPS